MERWDHGKVEAENWGSRGTHPSLYSMLLTALSLPLLASLSLGLFGRSIGKRGGDTIAIGSLLVSALLSLALGYEAISAHAPTSLELGGWLDTGRTRATWGFFFDPLRAWLVSTVLLVSLLVHVFASSYMAHDPAPQRFMALLLSFTGFMVLLVAGDNLAVLFLGWEGIGITSYLLIGYWFDRPLAGSSANQAIVVNRVGDALFTIALALLLGAWGSGSLDLLGINLSSSALGGGISSADASVPSLASPLEAERGEGWGAVGGVPLPVGGGDLAGQGEWSPLSQLGLLLVLAASGKSAQFLLHTWLPNAMEGPTPVSSLLHAATLVMGGVYLLLAFPAPLNSSPAVLAFAALLGIGTALFAATTALFQNDIKRTIAYSTCSQFGYLFASAGLSQSSSTVLHLSSHAGFKALLFICAGGVIHSMRDEQDMRRLGGTLSLLPFTYAAMLAASLSLAAFPYLSGNASKDLILELAEAQLLLPGQAVWLLGSLVAGLTALYSTKTLALTFYGEARGPRPSYAGLHEQPLGLVLPMTLLSLSAIFFGYVAREPLSSLGGDAPTAAAGSSHFPLPSVTGTSTLGAEGLDTTLSALSPSFPIADGDVGRGSSSLVEAEFGLDLLGRNLPLASSLLGLAAGLLLFLQLGSLSSSPSPSSPLPVVDREITTLPTSAASSPRQMGRGGDSAGRTPLPSPSEVESTRRERTGTLLFPSDGGAEASLSTTPPRLSASLLAVAPIVHALSKRWLVDPLLARAIVWPVLDLALFCSKVVDRGLLELLGPEGFARLARRLSPSPPSLVSTRGGEAVERGETPSPLLSATLPVAELREGATGLSVAAGGKSTSRQASPLFRNNVPEYALYVGLAASAALSGSALSGGAVASFASLLVPAMALAVLLF